MKSERKEMRDKITALELVDSEQAGAIKALKALWAIGGAAAGIAVAIFKLWKD